MGPVTCSGGFEAALRAFVEASVEAYTLGHSADALRAEARAALAEVPLRDADDDEFGVWLTLAFLALRDLDFVVVLDLEQARRGEAAAARPVRIGPKVAPLPPDAGPFLIQTARGHASGAVLALHPDLSTAFPVTRDSGNATAPMNGFRIRGARPLGMAELSGGLSETDPGLYRAATVLNQGGPHQLIVSAGPGRFTACLDFDVQGPVQSRLTLQLAAQDGGAQPQGRRTRCGPHPR